jgi:hypothetical protein
MSAVQWDTQIDGGGSLSRSRHLYEQKGGK